MHIELFIYICTSSSDSNVFVFKYLKIKYYPFQGVAPFSGSCVTATQKA